MRGRIAAPAGADPPARASQISCTRDDVDGARADCERALALARGSHDPIWLGDALGEVVEIYALADLLDEARSVADELLALGPEPALEVLDSLALVADRIGLDKGQLERSLLPLMPAHVIWRRVAELLLAGEFGELAELAAEIDLPDLEAEARLQAAEALLREERREEAGAEARKALAFFRSVRATRFVREAESILAETESAVRSTGSR